MEKDHTSQFLLTQFTALSSHIQGLFSAATQRLGAYLVFVGLLFTILKLLNSTTENLSIRIAILMFNFIIGYIIWKQSIHTRIYATRYLRILNNIRGHFASQNDEVSKICTDLLPTSIKHPKWNIPVFDPGIVILELILSITAILIPYSLLNGNVLFWTPLVLLVWFLLYLYRQDKIKKKLSS